MAGSRSVLNCWFYVCACQGQAWTITIKWYIFLVSMADGCTVIDLDLDEECPSSTPRLLSSNNKRSAVWLYFSSDAADKNCAICDLCRPLIERVKTKDSSTSNLWSHLKNHHPLEYSSLNSKSTITTTPKVQSTALAVTASEADTLTPSAKRRYINTAPNQAQPRITEAFERHTKYSSESRKYKVITEKLTTMFAKLMLPFNIIDELEFRDFCKELDSRYELPNRKFLSAKAIPQKFNEVKSRIMGELKLASSISLTTDGWSSNNTTPYLSLTGHFLSEDWKLKTYCLRTIYMPESHTGENIASMIRSILAEYDIHISIVTSITTDSAANMKKACTELDTVRLPCFGHILHNSINNAIKAEEKVTQMVKVCRNIVTAITSSFK